MDRLSLCFPNDSALHFLAVVAKWLNKKDLLNHIELSPDSSAIGSDAAMVSVSTHQHTNTKLVTLGSLTSWQMNFKDELCVDS